MWRIVYKTLEKTVILLLVTFFLCLAVVFMRLSHSPYSLDAHIDKIIKFIEPDGVDLSISHMDIRYDQSLKVYAEGVKLRNKITHTDLDVDQATFVFSNRNLALFRIVPKHVILQGVNLPLTLSKGIFEIAGFAIPLEGHAKGSLIDFLNHKKSPEFLKSIKKIQMDDLNVHFSDLLHSKQWYLENASGTFLRTRGEGDTLHISTQIRQSLNEPTSPAEITATHAENAKTLSFGVIFKDSETKLLENYIPIQGIVDMKGDVRFQANIDHNNHIKDPRFGFKVGKGSVHIQKAYNFPFTFNSAEFEGGYDNIDEMDTLIIDYLHVEDTNGNQIEISGYAENLKENPYVDVEAKITPTHISNIIGYLPDILLANTTSWIKNHVSNASVENFILKYKGYPKELPDCGSSCGFDGEFDFTDLALSFLNNTPPVTGVDGHFTMRDDFIYIQGYEGTLANQHVEDISVTIDGHFSAEIEDKIHIEAKAVGAIQGVIEILEKELQNGQLSGGKVDGRHSSHAILSFPLREPSFENLKLDVVSDLSDVETNSDVYTGGVSIVLPYASIKVTESDLEMAGKGSVDGIVGHASWHENMKNAFKETSIRLQGTLKPEKALLYVQDLGVNVEGDSNIDLSIKHQPKTGLWDYALNADMKPAELKHSGINWLKKSGDALSIKAKGVYGWQEHTLSASSIKIKGENEDVQGTFNWAGGKNKALTFDFPTFKLGQTNAHPKLSSKAFVLTGEALDLTKFSLGDSITESQKTKVSDGKNIAAQTDILPTLKNGKVRASLNKIYFLDGALTDVSLTVDRRNYIWETGELKTKVDAVHVLEGSLRTTETNKKVVDFYAKEAGQVLQTLGLTKNLRRGEMMGHVEYDVSSTGAVHGSGHISILKTNLTKAPILAKILSYLSLEQLLTDQKGILFDEVSVPFNIIDQLITFKNVSMKGPSIGLNFRGNYNMAKGEMDVKGRLIPVAGLNKVIGNIPVVGGILTGTQQGLLVADFTVKGKTSDAKVSANPLSIVTPGIVKDVIDVITGEDDFMEPADKSDKLFTTLPE